MDFSDTGLPIELKRIKGQRSIRIRVYSHQNRIVVTAPYLVSRKSIKQFVWKQLDWIKKHFRPIDFRASDLSVLLWGRKFKLSFEESNKSGFQIENGKVILFAPASKLVTYEDKWRWLNRFYLEQMKIAANPLVLKWQKVMSAPVKTLHFRKMSSRWGSCSPYNGRVCLNSELAKYPPEALEYVIVHELAHFFVSDHGPKFKALLNHYLPHWKTGKQLLDTPNFFALD
jgi:predicted metal-dependent hydrolase